MFNPTDRIAAAIPQLHGRTSVIEDGEVVSVTGSHATIILDNEDVPRTVPLAALTRASEFYGAETGRPNEMPVLDQIRR